MEAIRGITILLCKFSRVFEIWLNKYQKEKSTLVFSQIVFNSLTFALLFRKQERQKDRSGALADLSKLGNLGALTGLEIEEEEEEDEVFDQTYLDNTALEDDRQNSISIR